MMAGFAVGVLGEISEEALFFFLNNENLVNKKTLWSCMFLWCLDIVLWLVVMMKGLIGLGDKHWPRY